MTEEPKILDDYELVEEIGSGAFATVYAKGASWFHGE